MSLSLAANGRLTPCRGPVDAAVSARIDVLRIILIGLIVLCHGGRFLGTLVPFAGPGTEFAATAFNRGPACLAVPLFFCISGYLLLRKLELTPAGYVGLMAKKFLAIGVPFLLFNGIWIVWLLTVGSIENFGGRSFLLEAGIGAKLLGLGTSPLNYPLWFLRDLLKIIALTPLFLLFFRRLPITGLFLLGAVWFLESPADEYGLAGFAFWFYLGGLLARSRADVGKTARLDWWLLPLFVAATVVVGLAPWLGQDVYAYAALKKGYQMLGVLALWSLSRQSWLAGSGLLHRLAAYSFFIFLTHEPTVSVLQTRLLALWQPATAPGQMVAFFLPGLAAIILLYWLGRGLSRFSPGLYAIATGAVLKRRNPGATEPPRKPLSVSGRVAGGLLPPEAAVERDG
ncbi:acyltransferase [Desulfovibrio sp. DV]|uniref:acyltransferase family protein n=1 Tax=Desulfovibrio sp. DV TaxID=1844708 RepID=UPI00094B9420|nr:acyltransferase [Desulfovibrio sp. DV]